MSENQLGQMIFESLDDAGVLKDIQKDLDQNIVKLMNNEPLNNQSQDKKNQLKGKNAVINELIREYLQFNSYQYTHDIFVEELRIDKYSEVDRKYISKYLKVIEDSNCQEIPLLYGLVFGSKKLLTREFYQNYDNEGRQVSGISSQYFQDQDSKPKQIYQDIFDTNQFNI